jgi:hypothetical protein
VKLAGFAILGQIRKCEGLGPVDLNKNTVDSLLVFYPQV